ncbi:MAG: molybdopterin-dependent oxidoreductase [Coriobacteriales bacterium]|nr:molybdopterin-dependent oxidoreductase [Coriobacteriales bacterium]
MRQEWKWEEDGYEVIRSCAWSAPGDHPVGCGIKLYVKDGKLEKVEGDEEHPITQGRLCPRCLALKEYVYHPDRIIYPMKRDPKDRGNNDKWERITWDEAWETIFEKIRYFTDKYGPETIMEFTGTGRLACMYNNLLAYEAIGTPNCCYAYSGVSCWGPRNSVCAYVLGAGYPEIDYAFKYEDRYDHPGWPLPEYVVIWGKAPLESNADGLFGHSVVDMMKRGTKLISVDPRVNWLASRAEFHLQLRPGTDAAMALGWLNVIIEEDLYDHEFVDAWTYGFEQLAERVKEYPVEKVADITWVPAEKIRAAARAFAKAPAASIAWGVSADQNPNAPQISHAILALMAITNRIDAPGGNVLGGPPPLNPTGRDGETAMFSQVGEVMPPEIWQKRLAANDLPGYQEIQNYIQPDYTLEYLEREEPYKMRMGWIQSSNFLSPTCSAQPERWHDAVMKFDFNVGTDTFMNPTIQALADMFLPIGTFAEINDFAITHYGMCATFYGSINKAIDVGETVSDLEIALKIGNELHPELFPWDTPEAYFDAKLKNPAVKDQITFADLQNKGVLLPTNEYYKYKSGQIRGDGKPGFNTPTGRIELYSLLFQKFGEDPLPYYIEPEYSAVANPEIASKYPLILTTGARTFVSFHSEHRQIKTLREVVPDPLLEMHPDTAKEYGVTDGAWVYIENQWGKAKQRVKVTEGIMPGVVHAMHGWWFPEEEPSAPHLYGVWKSNVNNMIPSKHMGKLGFGSPFRSAQVTLYLATD